MPRHPFDEFGHEEEGAIAAGLRWRTEVKRGISSLKVEDVKIDVILPKSICRFHSILLKSQQPYFVEMGRMLLKFTWKLKKPKIAMQTC